MKKAFTIIELLVAVALLAILMAISGLVFAAAVKAYRTAGAATEIAAKLQVMTQQLDDDLRGLRKDGEFMLALVPEPAIDRNGVILNKDGDNYADSYLSFDRLIFFADGNFQSYDEQPVTTGSPRIVRGDNSIARICYNFGRDGSDWDSVENNYRSASRQPLGEKRMFCRTQHIVTANTDLVPFPDVIAWDQTKSENFYRDNFLYEYQTMPMDKWTEMTNVGGPDWQAKKDMLSYILDIKAGSSLTDGPSPWYAGGGPKIDQTTPQSTSNTVHQLFMQGVGQFRVQLWWTGGNRWYPEIDPNGDGNYSDSDYIPISDYLDLSLTERPVPVWWFPLYLATVDDIGPALKFTFTLYDSKGVFKDGKTFTHIVYLN